jgi:hypothetical protein
MSVNNLDFDQDDADEPEETLCECGEPAVGFADGQAYCAECYRTRPLPPPNYDDDDLRERRREKREEVPYYEGEE